MSTTTTTTAGAASRSTAIRVPDNVRALDQAHVEALAGSISLQGILVPLVVREHADGFELVAGFHRIAAAQALGLSDVPVVVRDVETRGRRPGGREHRAQAAQPLRGSQGRPGDARPRAERGRRGAGAGLAEDARDRAGEGA